MGKNQHVVKNPAGWAVRGAGNGKATVVKATQGSAIRAAIPIAKHEKSDVIIHGRDGRIRDRDSYGNDPCPPRDRKH